VLAGKEAVRGAAGRLSRRPRSEECRAVRAAPRWRRESGIELRRAARGQARQAGSRRVSGTPLAHKAGVSCGKALRQPAGGTRSCVHAASRVSRAPCRRSCSTTSGAPRSGSREEMRLLEFERPQAVLAVLLRAGFKVESEHNAEAGLLSALRRRQRSYTWKAQRVSMARQ